MFKFFEAKEGTRQCGRYLWTNSSFGEGGKRYNVEDILAASNGAALFLKVFFSLSSYYTAELSREGN